MQMVRASYSPAHLDTNTNPQIPYRRVVQATPGPVSDAPYFLTGDFSLNEVAAFPSVAVGNWTMINLVLDHLGSVYSSAGGSSRSRHVFQAGYASSTLVVAQDRPLSFRDLGF
jgi:hypothetical protein